MTEQNPTIQSQPPEGSSLADVRLVSFDHGHSDVFAILSLISGILSVLSACCCFVFGVPFSFLAMVFGVVALVRIHRDRHGRKGRELAIAGIICGAVALLMAILLWSLTLSFRAFEHIDLDDHWFEQWMPDP